MEIICIRRDVGFGPAINEFSGLGGQVHTAVTTRTSIIVMPPGAMESIARASKERTPRHTGQAIYSLLLNRVAFIRHVDRGSFVIGEEFPFGCVCASHSARTALRKEIGRASCRERV